MLKEKYENQNNKCAYSPILLQLAASKADLLCDLELLQGQSVTVHRSASSGTDWVRERELAVNQAAGPIQTILNGSYALSADSELLPAICLQWVTGVQIDGST